VEVGIMCNSLYLALWATNFISIVNRELDYPQIWQIGMCLPLIVVLPTLGNIVKVASNLWAISDLQLDVISGVLESMEDRLHLIEELRQKVLVRIGGLEIECKEVIDQLFQEINRDQSGELSSSELRDLLRALHLHYSDDKFRRLFKGLDFNQDGGITLDELKKVLFPEEAKQHEMRMRQETIDKYNTQNTSRKDLLCKEQNEKKHSFMAKLSRRFSGESSFVGHMNENNVEAGVGTEESSTQSMTNRKINNFAAFLTSKLSSTEGVSSVVPLNDNQSLPEPNHTFSTTGNNKSISVNTSQVEYVPPSRSRAMSDVYEKDSIEYGDKERGIKTTDEIFERDLNRNKSTLQSKLNMPPLNQEDDEDSDISNDEFQI
jgi:hypothetical protein